MTQHCGDTSPHGRHTWYGPGQGDAQVQYSCPGTPEN